MLNQSTVSCLNDYYPIELTPIVMKCFVRLFIWHMKTQLPPSLDPLQFVMTLHLPLDHLHKIIPQHLIKKLKHVPLKLDSKLSD